MFRTCTHKDVAASLEAISAAFVILEVRQHKFGSMVLVSANSMFEEISAKPIAECVGLSLVEFLPRYIEKQMRACIGLCLTKRSSQDTEVIVEREGTSRWWRFLVSPIVPVEDENERVIVTMTEITEKKLLESTLDIARQRYEAVVQTASDGIVTIDENQTIKLMNDAARDIFGITNEREGVGDLLSRFIPNRFHNSHAQYINGFSHSAVNVRPMQPRSSVYGIRTDGSEVPIEVTISKIRVGNGTEMTAVIRDISERTKLIEQLQRAATRDPLTGIYNRRHGTAILNAEIHRAQRFNHPLAIALLDLDHFKVINDTYGHGFGDLVLNSFISTVSHTLRDIDTLCRWGGEEFLVVLPQTGLDDAVRWAERAREAVASEAITGLVENTVRISSSFGIAEMASAELTTLEDFVKRADDALYRAKENGRNQVCAAPTKTVLA